MTTDTQANAKIYAISEIAGAVKRTLEDRFGHIRVQGEVSKVTNHANGHIYFTVKDKSAALDCVVWRGTASRLQHKPEHGAELVLTGRISSYPVASRYQLIVDRVELAGIGALLAKLEELKKKLAAEGIFAPDKKRPLPLLPKTIGVISSPTGAVIRDILHRIRDRFPTRVILWPVTVQGPNAARDVAHAIQGFNTLAEGGHITRPDVLIVARGGGSVEDLWPFNDEHLVRTAAASDIPLISAIGHETDTTLIDYAADRRAPTPTAAAEMATPIRADLLAMLQDGQTRLTRGCQSILDASRNRLKLADKGLPQADALLATPRQRLDMAAFKLDTALQSNTNKQRRRFDRLGNRIQPTTLRANVRLYAQKIAGLRLDTALRTNTQTHQQTLVRTADQLKPQTLQTSITQNQHNIQNHTQRLQTAMQVRMDKKRDHLKSMRTLLTALSYKSTLDRGYAVIKNNKGEIVTSTHSLAVQEQIDILFADGTARAKIQ